MASATFSERTVLDYLLYRPETTVQQVADQFALSSSTVSNICTRLLEKRLIVRAAGVAQGRGRPALTYRAALPGLVAVVSFDGSHVDAALFEADSTLLASATRDLSRIDKMPEALDIVDELVAHLLSQAQRPRRELAFLTVSANALRTRRGTLSSSVLPWVTDKLSGALEQRLAINVQVISASMTMAEFHHMDDPAVQTIVRFHVGDGVSSHAMIFGRIATGHNDLAGELGHVTLDPSPDAPLCGCGKRGCVEAFLSGPAIRRTVRAALEAIGKPTCMDKRVIAGRSVRLAIDHVWQAWVDRDPLARNVMDGILDKLAWALSISLNLLDPDLVRVDGYVLRDRQEWIDELNARVRPQLLRSESRDIRLENARASLIDQQRFAAYQGLIDYVGRSSRRQEIPV